MNARLSQQSTFAPPLSQTRRKIIDVKLNRICCAFILNYSFSGWVRPMRCAVFESDENHLYLYQSSFALCVCARAEMFSLFRETCYMCDAASWILPCEKSSFQMFPKAAVWILAAACVWCAEECACFPNGSVALSCGDMMPIHPPFKPSSSTPPVILSASSATYRPGGLITREWIWFSRLIRPAVTYSRFSLLLVTVEVVQNSSTEFQGFLVQARSRQGNGNILDSSFNPFLQRFSNFHTAG